MAREHAFTALMLAGLGLLSACGSDKLSTVHSYQPTNCSKPGAYCNPPVNLDGGLYLGDTGSSTVTPDAGFVIVDGAMIPVDTGVFPDAAEPPDSGAQPPPDSGVMSPPDTGPVDTGPPPPPPDAGPPNTYFDGTYNTHYEVNFKGPLAGLHDPLTLIYEVVTNMPLTVSLTGVGLIDGLLAQAISNTLPPTAAASILILEPLAQTSIPLHYDGQMTISGTPDALIATEAVTNVLPPTPQYVSVSLDGSPSSGTGNIQTNFIAFPAQQGRTVTINFDTNVLLQALTSIIGGIQCSQIGDQITQMTGVSAFGSIAQTWCTGFFAAAFIANLVTIFDPPSYSFSQQANVIPDGTGQHAAVLQGMGLPIGDTINPGNGDYHGVWIGCLLGATVPGVCPPP
jgi:hypothetical protein